MRNLKFKTLNNMFGKVDLWSKNFVYAMHIIVYYFTENGKDFFWDIEKKRVYIADIIGIFDESKYLADLVDKPKIFLLQFCRSEF